MFRECLKLVVARGHEQICAHGHHGAARHAAPDGRSAAAEADPAEPHVERDPFTPDGGRVEAVAELAADGGIVIVIQDTGIGMAPEQIPAALEPFRQIASPYHARLKARGWQRLSLAKSLTRRHGGTLAIRSALNQGTSVELPFRRG